MTFHETRFPTGISRAASGGPERRTEIVVLGSGREERNARWAHSRRRYNAGLGLRSLDDVHNVVRFFEARHGRLHGFRWKDHADYKSCAPLQQASSDDQVIGTGDGTTNIYQLVKDYASGAQSYQRSILKPVTGTVVARAGAMELTEGADFTVEAASGRIILNAPPASGAQITAGFEFDVPVRFDTDFLEINLAAFTAGEIPDIPILEVRL